ncbi:MAG TPA: ISKra4 family transposase [Thermomicrobiales bacterium]|nr:ISKra4 family transposase [Thermomicrobiales bacterium]
MEDSTAAATQALVAQAAERAGALARELSAWAVSGARTLGDVERQTLALVKEFGQQLLAGVCAVVAAGEPARERPCPCGGTARYIRHRPAQVLTVLGAVSITRAYYHCARCRGGHAPLDQRLGYRAGSTSAGLEEILALLGATAGSFEEAVGLLDKLTLVRVCPNLARDATERLGQALQGAEQQAVAAAWERGVLPPAGAAPPRLYLSMDGVLVQTSDGWREYKLGAVYTTVTRPSRRHPGQDEIHAREFSFVGDVADAATFGQLLWCEAARRGVLDAGEVVVVADGAHWIWDLVAEHFPAATQIVDWYHASQYVWAVAHAVYGEGTPRARRWAKRRLADLWAGRVEQVLKACAAHRQRGQAVEEALTYYTNHRHRMRYAEYRARGLQVGSGSIESGCKQVIAARLKQAGMRWSLDGARTVAAVRTWVKSGRWHEAMALRPPRRRTYQRQAA